MKITQKKIDDLNGELQVVVEPADYAIQLEKALKDYRKKSVIPGFRKGKTPMGIINKKYRTPVLIDEINQLIQSKLYNYIRDENLRILGSPIPKKGEKKIDWENDAIFTFQYDIGFSPDIDVKITKKDKLDYYIITADKKLIDKYCLDISKRYGKMSNPEISEKGDLILCVIEQLDLDGNLMKDGIKNESTVAMDFISDKKTKQKFIGVKSGDSFDVNVIKSFTNTTDLASMLNVKEDDLKQLVSQDFLFTIKNVSRLDPAEFNKELFDKVYGEGVVKTEKAFRDKIKEESEHSFIVESDRMLKNDVVSYLLKQIDVSIPDDFLKRWLEQSSEEMTSEKVEDEYAMYAKSLRWQLIENEIFNQFDIKISDEEMKDHVKELVVMQMKQYGQPIPDENKMKSIIDNILQKEEEKKRIYNQVSDIKTLKIYKDVFKLEEKAISYDDFIKLASEK